MTALPARACLITTWTANRAIAERLAAALVDSRLAAATHLTGPVLSRFRWSAAGENPGVHRSEEWGVEAVTTPDRLDAVVARMTELHDYALPSITALEASCTQAFADWVHDQTH